ncbi:MAG: DUF6086 family protein [Aeromicrobium sp.]
MSQQYICDNEVLWNPSNGASRVFLGQVRLFEDELSTASGLGPMEADECRIDAEQFAAFAQALLSYSQTTNHQVLHTLMDGVVVTVLALVERAGLAVQVPAQTDRHDLQVSREPRAPDGVPEDELRRRARDLLASMPR